MLSVGIFAVAYFFLDQTHIDKFLPQNKIEAMIYFPMLIIAPLSAIFVHELGHLLTGLALKQRLELFVVAFFGLRNEHGKIKIFLNKNVSFFGGLAATVPKTEKDIDPSAFSKILIAGPIYSLIYCILCFWIFFQCDSYFNAFFALSVLTSFGMFLATTLPDKSGIMFTDRKRYQRLNSKGIERDSEIVMYQIITQSIIENSFKNIEIQKIQILEKESDSTTQFWAAYLKFMYYRENGHTDQENKSLQKLQEFKTVIPQSIWKTLNID